MPEYLSAQALLADVHLRLEGLGPNSVALVVEGNDDKRLFYRRVTPNADIVPAGGKRLLRASLEVISDQDKGRIIFLTDCDYDVSSGILHGGPDVVITSRCDIEADLVELGLFEKIAIEITPGAIGSKESAAKIAIDVREHAEMLAIPLGRIRRTAQPLGVDLKIDGLDLSKLWNQVTDSLESGKLDQIIWERLRKGGAAIDYKEWRSQLDACTNDPTICNGKDLIRSAQMFFRTRHKMDSKITADKIAIMMRLAVDQADFEAWPVVQRIRKWEGRYGRSLLSA